MNQESLGSRPLKAKPLGKALAMVSFWRIRATQRLIPRCLGRGASWRRRRQAHTGVSSIAGTVRAGEPWLARQCASKGDFCNPLPTGHWGADCQVAADDVIVGELRTTRAAHADSLEWLERVSAHGTLRQHCDRASYSLEAEREQVDTAQRAAITPDEAAVPSRLEPFDLPLTDGLHPSRATAIHGAARGDELRPLAVVVGGRQFSVALRPTTACAFEMVVDGGLGRCRGSRSFCGSVEFAGTPQPVRAEVPEHRGGNEAAKQVNGSATT